MYAGKGVLGVGGSPLAITRYTVRGIGKTPVLACGQSVDSNLTMGYLPLSTGAPPCPMTHALVFM